MTKTGIRLGLDRVHRALTLLDHPEDQFASILIAGTNGKGSVASLIESVLRTAGFRTGLFTSPHLVHERERVRVAGRSLSSKRWAQALQSLSPLVSRLSLTEFERHTLAAFLSFRQNKVDIAVVEVGLGGRLDATNTLPSPEATIITSIGHDHQEWLGKTLPKIYGEKYGIARSGTPMIQSLPSALRSWDNRFRQEKNVPTLTLGREIFHRSCSVQWSRRRQTLDVQVLGKNYPKLKIGLMGPHQKDNAALAVATCDILRRKGWPLSESHIRRGLAQTKWAGRFQVIKILKRTIIIDGAHNPEAMQAFVSAYRASPWGRKKATLIFSCLKDKDASALVRVLRASVRRVILVPLPTPRSCSPETLAPLWRGVPTLCCKNFNQAWRQTKKETGSPLLITGSLSLVGETMRFFKGKIPQ